MSLFNKTFTYDVEIGYNKKYSAVYERQQSYLADQNGKPLLYFGGSTGANSGWGRGVRNSPRANLPAPVRLKIRWFSVTENQFWQGDFKLPTERIAEIFATKYAEIRYPNRKRQQIGTIVINVTPGGLVVVWASVGVTVFQVAEFQATKTTMDWAEFEKHTIEYKRERNLYVANKLKMVPEKIIEEIKTKTLPIDAAPWRQLQTRYSWRFQATEPFKLKDYQTWYNNGELYYTYKEQVDQYQPRAVPNNIIFYIEFPDKSLKRFTMKLNFENDPKPFIDFVKKYGEPFDLQIQFVPDSREVYLYLANAKGKQEIKYDRLILEDRLYEGVD